MRKATFTKTDEGYRPVNQLAKLVSDGHTLDAHQVRLIAKDGLARPYIWTDAGLRQSFRG
jgi:hypothetical protein